MQLADLELARRLERAEGRASAAERYAFRHGCDVAAVVVEPGSKSQRNAEREGFRVAYTRTKWRLFG